MTPAWDVLIDRKDLRATQIQPAQGPDDRAPHRAGLPPTYNAYAEAPQGELDDHRALLRPLLTAYSEVLEGRARPEDGHIIRPL